MGVTPLLHLMSELALASLQPNSTPVGRFAERAHSLSEMENLKTAGDDVPKLPYSVSSPLGSWEAELWDTCGKEGVCACLCTIVP